MRVLFLIDSLKMGGAERITVSLLPHFKQIEPILCTLYCDENDLADSVGDIPHFCLGATRLRDIGAIRRFLKLLDEQRIDVIHAQLQHASVFATIARRLKGIPVVITRHVVYDDESTWRKRLLVRAERLALRYGTDKIVYVSDATKNFNREQLGLPDARLVTIYNGIQADKFDITEDRTSLKERLGLPQDAFLVVMVGVMRPGKGHTVAIESARQLAQTTENIRFIFVGDGELGAELRDSASDLTEQVLFLGTRSDIPEILSACDVLILPSDSEALPTVLIEAGAAHLPSIASNVGGVPEIIIDGETGIIIPSGNPTALTNAIKELSTQPDRVHQMGKKAYERVLANFTLTHQAQILTDLYRSLIRK